MGGALKRERRHRGFTLIELLVVMGIILVLVGILVLGIRHTNALAGRHATEAELKLCEGMLAEYKAVNGYKNIIGEFDSAVKTNPLPIQLPRPWITGQY